jgi:two-component system phosphate regulon sensor histidine kinase PhoR
MSKRRILVVDDEAGIREGCRRVLASEGHDVDVAEDGKPGLDMYRSDGYDLVLVDLHMPGMSGMELLNALRERDREAVTVVITAYASLDTAVEATKRGSYDYLAKPFTPDELTAVVSRALEHRRLLVEARELREQRQRDLLALAGEQSRLRTVIDCMSDGLLVMNRESQLALFNPAALRLLGLPELPLQAPVSECLGCRELSELMQRALTSKTSERASQEISLNSGGQESVVLATVAPVADEAGAWLGVVAVLRDVTTAKEIQRLKASFVSMVSHELRAPLAAVRGYLDVILGGFTGGNPEKERTMHERMRLRTDALLALVDDLLTMSRMEQTNQSHTLERVSVDEAVSDILPLFEAEAQTNGVSLHATPSPESLTVMADGEELRRLLTNLVSNAIKYNQRGGSVTIQAEPVGATVRVSVTDTGIGIPAECLPKLGQEFYRVKTPVTRRITGTGLGLAVVKRIVEGHNGRLEVTSECGRGSTFTIFLPRPGA